MVGFVFCGDVLYDGGAVMLCLWPVGSYWCLLFCFVILRYRLALLMDVDYTLFV